MRIYYLKKDGTEAVDITNLATSFKTSCSFKEDKLLGNTPSLMVEVELNNVDGALSNCAEGSFYIDINEIDKEGIPTQKFLVLEAPEKYTAKLSLTLYDLMVKFNKAYKSALTYGNGQSTTISAQLDEMSSMTGVEIDKGVLPEGILNAPVGWIDTQIIMRDYIGWISELSGHNAYITEDNKLSFRKLFIKNHDIEYASDFDKTDLMTISRVLFEDGVNSIASGDETGKTLYIDTTNTYCDNQSFTDAIHKLYNGVQFSGLENMKTIGFDGLNLGDTVTYDGVRCIVTSVNRNYAGEGSGFSLDGKVSLKARDSIVTKIPDIVRIRRVQTIIDQVNNLVQILAKDVDGNKELIAKFQTTANQIEGLVTSKKVTDERLELLESSLKQTAESLSFVLTKKDINAILDQIKATIQLDGIHVQKDSSSKKEAIYSDEQILFKGKDGDVRLKINEIESYFGKYVTYGSHRFEAFEGYEWDESTIGGISESTRVMGTGAFLTRNEDK